MKRFTLSLIGICFMFFANAQTQKAFNHSKTKQLISGKYSNLASIINENDSYLKKYISKSGLKSETDIPAEKLDSIVVVNRQFESEESWQYQFGYNLKGLNTYMKDIEPYEDSDDYYVYDSTSYTYNSFDKEDLRTYFARNDNDNLEKLESNKYIYGENNRLDSIINTYYLDGVWAVAVTEFIYNEQSQVSTTIVWVDYATGEFEKIMKAELYYSSETALLDSVETYYTGIDEPSTITSTMVYEYNDDDLLVKITEKYPFDEEQSYGFAITEIQYQNGVPTEIVYSTGDDPDGYSKEVLVYENNNPVVGPILLEEEADINYLQFGKLTRIDLFDNEGEGWYDSGTVDFYYSGWETGIARKKQPENLNVYPNPANSEINIDVTPEKQYSMNICDVSGKSILEIASFNGVADISSLKNGFYIIQLKSNDEIIGISKFMKQ